MALKLDMLDHLVLTVTDPDRTVGFYETALGMTAERFTGADGTERLALKYGAQKINLHAAGSAIEPRAATPMPGSADLCFLTSGNLEDWQAHLHGLGITIEIGPVPRTGATGPITSLYLRDPDSNLIEIATRD